MPLLMAAKIFAAMPKGNAKVLQVLVAEVRKDGNINVVIGKELGVLLKPKFPKPSRDLPAQGRPRNFLRTTE